MVPAFPMPPLLSPRPAPAASAQQGNAQSPALASFGGFDDANDVDEEFEATIVIARGRSTTDWSLVDIDGTRFPLAPTNVLGRKPTSGPNDAQFIALSDPERVLSRTHLLIEVEGDQLWVTDLKSTNGTEVLLPVGDVIDPSNPACVRPCETLNRYAVTANQGLSLGGRTITFDGPASS